jgi:hypothetical protein
MEVETSNRRGLDDRMGRKASQRGNHLWDGVGAGRGGVGRGEWLVSWLDGWRGGRG